eukprot:jgi/Ulvmu1/7613/UM038_0038.1
MDEFDTLSYTVDHIQHFGKRLQLAYPTVALSAALATSAARERLVATVEAAWSGALRVNSRSVAADVEGRVITSTNERDRWLFPKDEAEVLKLYRDPDCISKSWAVQGSDRATASARVARVLHYIEASPEEQTPSRSLVATAILRTGHPVFLYRGATLSESCITEYEDHQPSVETDFATAYCWSETVPGPDQLENFTVSCPVSLDVQGTWPGYANDRSTLEEALGHFMSSQIDLVERRMHQDGWNVPWLEAGTRCKPVGERKSNVSMEPAIYYKASLQDGQPVVTDVEFFMIGRATADINIGEEALLEYGQNFWDKQGTVIAGMLDVALLQRRLKDSQRMVAELKAEVATLQKRVEGHQDSLLNAQELTPQNLGEFVVAGAVPCSAGPSHRMGQHAPSHAAQRQPGHEALSGKQDADPGGAVHEPAEQDGADQGTHALPSPGQQGLATSKSGSRQRKGWTGSWVGLTHPAHASADLSPRADGTGRRPDSHRMSQQNGGPIAVTTRTGSDEREQLQEHWHSAPAAHARVDKKALKQDPAQCTADATAAPPSCDQTWVGDEGRGGDVAAGGVLVQITADAALQQQAGHAIEPVRGSWAEVSPTPGGDAALVSELTGVAGPVDQAQADDAAQPPVPRVSCAWDENVATGARDRPVTIATAGPCSGCGPAPTLVSASGSEPAACAAGQNGGGRVAEQVQAGASRLHDPAGSPDATAMPNAAIGPLTAMQQPPQQQLGPKDQHQLFTGDKRARPEANAAFPGQPTECAADQCAVKAARSGTHLARPAIVAAGVAQARNSGSESANPAHGPVKSLQKCAPRTPAISAEAQHADMGSAEGAAPRLLQVAAPFADSMVKQVASIEVQGPANGKCCSSCAYLLSACYEAA